MIRTEKTKWTIKGNFDQERPVGKGLPKNFYINF